MRHIFRRILFYLGAAWAAVTINFFLPRLAPGSPVSALLAQKEKAGIIITPEYRQALEASFGLNSHEPIWSQYFSYLSNLLQGKLGISFSQYPESVWNVIGRNLPWTLGLVGIAVIISFTLGCLIGIFLAWRRGTWADSVLAPLMNFLSAIPYFWMALIILYVLGVVPSMNFHVTLFPVAGNYNLLYYDINDPTIWYQPDFLWDLVMHGTLPAITIVLASIAGWMLTMRNSMITTLSEDYVLMAKAKGLRPKRVIFSYAARNAILPNVTSFAISIGFVVAGQLLTERVFSYRGIGFALFQAVQANDYPLVQGIFLVIALAVLFANFIADIAYTFLDPRVRQEGNE